MTQNEKVTSAIDHNQYKLIRELQTNMNADVEWQLKKVKAILEEKRNLSRLYHEMHHVDMETEQTFTQYIDWLNETLAKILNIDYKYFTQP